MSSIGLRWMSFIVACLRVRRPVQQVAAKPARAQPYSGPVIPSGARNLALKRPRSFALVIDASRFTGAGQKHRAMCVFLHSAAVKRNWLCFSDDVAAGLSCHAQ